jgi:hypothetical protein
LAAHPALTDLDMIILSSSWENISGICQRENCAKNFWYAQATDSHRITISDPGDLPLELDSNFCVKKVAFIKLFILRARNSSELSMIEAAVYCLGLDIVFWTEQSSDRVTNIELLRLIKFVLEALQQMAVKAKALISLQIADIASIASLQL